MSKLINSKSISVKYEKLKIQDMPKKEFAKHYLAKQETANCKK